MANTREPYAEASRLRTLPVDRNLERVLVHVRRPRLAIVRRILRFANVRIVLPNEVEIRAEDSAYDLALVRNAVIRLDPTLAQTRLCEIGHTERVLRHTRLTGLLRRVRRVGRGIGHLRH